MKKIFRMMTVATVAVAMMGFVACEKDNDNIGGQQGGDTPSVDPTYETLVGTEWEGIYFTYDQTPGYTQYSITIHWTLDFLADGQGEIMFWFESQAYDADAYTASMTYTFDAASATGSIAEWEYGSGGNFIVDPYNRTLVIDNLSIAMGENESSVYIYGGNTVFHQVR